MTHILIVDDSILNSALAKDILQSSGYETSEIECGEDLQGQLERQVVTPPFPSLLLQLLLCKKTSRPLWMPVLMPL